MSRRPGKGPWLETSLTANICTRPWSCVGLEGALGLKHCVVGSTLFASGVEAAMIESLDWKASIEIQTLSCTGLCRHGRDYWNMGWKGQAVLAARDMLFSETRRLRGSSGMALLGGGSCRAGGVAWNLSAFNCLSPTHHYGGQGRGAGLKYQWGPLRWAGLRRGLEISLPARKR